MTNRTRTAVVLLFLIQAGCDRSDSPLTLSPSPASPPVPPPAPSLLIEFRDVLTGLSTVDVHDLQEQIVRFNLAGELIWASDDTHFPGYPIVQGNYIKADFSYQVRFGTLNGERRAYFAGHDWDVVYDLEVVDGRLVITTTNVPVPGT